MVTNGRYMYVVCICAGENREGEGTSSEMDHSRSGNV